MFLPPYNMSRLLTAGGFSIMELLVSISILTIITGAVLANHASFGGSILVENLAYDVALSIRQAQVFGLSVREFGAGSGSFDLGYGVHFDYDARSQYRLFADANKNKIYDAGDGTQEVFTVGRGYSVSDFCATLPGGVERCAAVGEIDELDITFIRPDPDAYIRVDGDAVTLYQSARIIVVSPQGTDREVAVESTGQISVSQE